MFRILSEKALGYLVAVSQLIVFNGSVNLLSYHFIVNENPYMSPGSTDQRKTIFLEQAERREWE